MSNKSPNLLTIIITIISLFGGATPLVASTANSLPQLKNSSTYIAKFPRNRNPRSTNPAPSGNTDSSLPSIGELGINLGGAYYHASGNQLIAWNNQIRGSHPFECVEFAYGRSIERGLFKNNQGIATVLNGDAHTWDDKIANSNYRGQLGSSVRANSIVVWEANQKFNWTDGNTTYTWFSDPVAGHVAFVEKVYPDGSFVISEGIHQSQPSVHLIKGNSPVAAAAKFIYL